MKEVEKLKELKNIESKLFEVYEQLRYNSKIYYDKKLHDAYVDLITVQNQLKNFSNNVIDDIDNCQKNSCFRRCDY